MIYANYLKFSFILQLIPICLSIPLLQAVNIVSRTTLYILCIYPVILKK